MVGGCSFELQNLQKHQESNSYNTTFMVAKNVATNPNTMVFKKKTLGPQMSLHLLLHFPVHGISTGSTQTAPPPLVYYRRLTVCRAGMRGSAPQIQTPKAAQVLNVEGARTPHTGALHACGLPRLCIYWKVCAWKCSPNPNCLGPSEGEFDKEGEGRQGGKRCLVSK